MPLHTVEPQRLYRQIASQLRGLITAGEFSPGARLPSERDLAVQLGVSRPSVREALIAMEVEGWIEVRTGSGVYVLERSNVEREASTDQALNDDWGPLELIRARRVVEGETAALAAAQPKKAQAITLTALQTALVSMRADAGRGVLPLDGDSAFHAALAAASGNAVLSDVVERFWQSRRGPLFQRLGGYFETVHSWHAAIAEHEAIFAAVAQRDASAARWAMHQHMDKAHERLSVSWRQAQPPQSSATSANPKQRRAKAVNSPEMHSVPGALPAFLPSLAASPTHKGDHHA